MFHLLPTPQGLALAGIILAKRNTDGSFAVAGREKIIHAQLQAAYGKQVSPHAMRYIRRGCELLAKLSDEELEAAAYPFHPNPYAKVNAGHGFSDLAKGLMLLALSGLNALEDIDAGRERLLTLRRSSRPDALLKSYGLPTWEELTKDDDSDEDDEGDDSDDEDDGGGGNSRYNPDEPRIPAGQPGGGQWTTAGNGTSTDSESISADNIRQALVDRFNNPAPQAQGVQVAADDGVINDANPSVPASLKAIVTEPLTFGPDGAFSSSVQWQLSSPSPLGGYIVQEVNAHLYETDQGSVVTDAFLHYWEAWQILPGSDAPVPQDNGKPVGDHFGLGPQPMGLNGTISLSTSARFYEGLILSDDFKLNNPDTKANDLRSTTQDPMLSIANATPPVERKFTHSW